MLDPWSTFAQGEGVLRQQLSALSRDHLLAVIEGYALPIEIKASASDRELIEAIVQTMHCFRRGEWSLARLNPADRLRVARLPAPIDAGATPHAGTRAGTTPW